MTKISSYSVDTHINGFINQVKTNRGRRLHSVRTCVPESFLRGATATVVGEFYDYSAVSAVGREKKLGEIKVVIDSIIDIGHGVLAVYAEVDTNRGMLKGYFDINSVTAIDDTTATEPRKCVRKCLSQLRREMRKAATKFPYAMFTPGTRCKVTVSGETKEITVVRLSQGGPNHFCIDTGIKVGGDCEILKDMTDMYHIDYVTEVLEHKAVPLVIDRYEGHHVEDGRPEDDVRSRMSRKNGRSNRYCGGLYDVIRNVINDLPHRVGQVYDIEKLISLLNMQGIFQHVRTKTPGEGWYSNWVITANKKKVKRAVRRLHGKISSSARVKQELEDEQTNREMASMSY